MQSLPLDIVAVIIDTARERGIYDYEKARRVFNGMYTRHGSRSVMLRWRTVNRQFYRAINRTRTLWLELLENQGPVKKGPKGIWVPRYDARGQFDAYCTWMTFKLAKARDNAARWRYEAVKRYGKEERLSKDRLRYLAKDVDLYAARYREIDAFAKRMGFELPDEKPSTLQPPRKRTRKK